MNNKLKQNSIRPVFNTFFLFIIMIMVFGCEVLNFHKPMPPNAKSIRTLPDFLKGTYLLEAIFIGEQDAKHNEWIGVDYFGKEYFDIELVNSQHCIIYVYTQNDIDIVIDSLESKKNISNVTIIGSTIKFKRNDDIEFIENLTLVGNNKIRTGREIAFEIDLAKGTIINVEDNNDELKILLKVDEGKYILNVFLESNWVPFVILDKNDVVELKSITGFDDLEFKDNLSYYSGISKIEKMENGQYIASPTTNNEFYTLISEPPIISRWVLKRIDVDEKSKISTIYLILIGVVILVIIVLIRIKKRKT